MAAQTPRNAAVPPPAPAEPPIQTDRSRKPQFSLRAMLIAMTAFAVVAAFSQFIGLAPIISFAGIVGALFVTPVALATLAVFSRGRRRTFFAGAFAGSLAAHYLIVMFSMGGRLWMLMMLGLVQLAAIVSCGATAVLARRFAERRGWHLPPSDGGG